MLNFVVVVVGWGGYGFLRVKGDRTDSINKRRDRHHLCYNRQEIHTINK